MNLLNEQIKHKHVRFLFVCTHTHSEPPHDASALSAARQHISPAPAFGRLVRAVSGPVEGARARGAEAEAAVAPATHTLGAQRVTAGRVLTARTRLQVLVTEQGFCHLRVHTHTEREREISISQQVTIWQNYSTIFQKYLRN